MVLCVPMGVLCVPVGVPCAPMGVLCASAGAFRQPLLEGGNAAAVGGGHEQGRAETEAREVGHGGFGWDAVDLVRDEQRAGTAAAQVVRDFFV